MTCILIVSRVACRSFDTLELFETFWSILHFVMGLSVRHYGYFIVLPLHFCAFVLCVVADLFNVFDNLFFLRSIDFIVSPSISVWNGNILSETFFVTVTYNQISFQFVLFCLQSKHQQTEDLCHLEEGNFFNFYFISAVHFGCIRVKFSLGRVLLLLVWD